MFVVVAAIAIFWARSFESYSQFLLGWEDPDGPSHHMVMIESDSGRIALTVEWSGDSIILPPNDGESECPEPDRWPRGYVGFFCQFDNDPPNGSLLVVVPY
jgi:hypothetical protein